MEVINRWGRKVYAKYHGNRMLSSIMQWMYHKLSPIIYSYMRSYKYRAKQEVPLEGKREIRKSLKEVQVAIICDEMTFEGFKNECQCVFVTPANWMTVFRNVKPDIFFCESAWSGIKPYDNCWRGRIYKSNKTKFENRKDLLNILDFCHRNDIPTVFWNKEDPTFFGDQEHNFVDTALLFDYIYTTSVECVAKYRQLGHKRVDTLMFGFAPKLFNPIGRNSDMKKAVFAGSWYNDQTERCQDMEKVFDSVLKAGLELQIFDRHWETNNPINRFPDKYQDYIHKGVSFNKLNELLKTAEYGININTVKHSKTMFARRVFEMMASGLMVISNESEGMRELFGEDIWFVDHSFDINHIEESRRNNFRQVFLHHTCRHRLQKVMLSAGVLTVCIEPVVWVIYPSGKNEESKRHFERITYKSKKGVIRQNNKLYHLQDNSVCLEAEIAPSDYVINIVDIKHIPDIELMIAQFSYIDEECGICEKEPRYTYSIDDNNGQTLFIARRYKNISNNKFNTKKYHI